MRFSFQGQARRIVQSERVWKVRQAGIYAVICARISTEQWLVTSGWWLVG